MVILGGSHSAFSAARTLLERLPSLLAPQAGVQILYRRAPRVFYASRADAAADFYGFTAADVCPATGRVHRLGGLRGDGRELWRRMQGLGGAPAEQRAVARPLGDLSGGELHALAASGPVVDAWARLRTADGGVLANVFGIGLGSGFRPWGPMAGEPGFRGQQNSLWLYQHGLGALIHDAVQHWAAHRSQGAEMPAAPWWPRGTRAAPDHFQLAR